MPDPDVQPDGSGSGISDDTELDRRIRSLDRKVRRAKLQVERVNPIERPEDHADRFEALVELEVELRELRSRSGGTSPRTE